MHFRARAYEHARVRPRIGRRFTQQVVARLQRRPPRRFTDYSKSLRGGRSEPTIRAFHGRVLVEGERAGIDEAVRTAVQAAGQAGSPDEVYLDAVEAALSEDTDAAAWQEVRAQATDCPDVNEDSDRPLHAALEERFGVEGRDAVLDALRPCSSPSRRRPSTWKGAGRRSSTRSRVWTRHR